MSTGNNISIKKTFVKYTRRNTFAALSLESTSDTTPTAERATERATQRAIVKSTLEIWKRRDLILSPNFLNFQKLMTSSAILILLTTQKLFYAKI